MICTLMMSEQEGKELPVRHDSSISFSRKKEKKRKKPTTLVKVLLYDITDGRNIHENVSCKFQGHGSAVSCTQSSRASSGGELADAELQAHPIYGT